MARSGIQRPTRPRSSGRPPRRGVAVLVVMLLLCVTLALSYASVRSQYTGLLIHHNAQRRSSARHAAMIGMTMAIKNMHQRSWVGVDNAIADSLSATEGYAATFTTGDASLSAGDDNYDDYPYRVTVVSTGYAIDPDNPARTSQYRIQAVLELIPRALSDEPAGFANLTQYSLCQWTAGNAYLNVPVQVAGSVRLRSQLRLGEHLAWNFDPRRRYLDDLRMAHERGDPDYRPLTGPVTYPFSLQSETTKLLVRTALGANPQDGSSSAEFAWPGDDLLQPYRLYPGGKLYSPQVLRGTLRNRSFEPDPLTNPLGIFVSSGAITIDDTVTIRGTLATTSPFSGDVLIDGSGVSFLPHDLPPVEGEDRPIRLPGVVSAEDLQLRNGASMTATGLLIAAAGFRADRVGQNNLSLSLSGTAAGKDIELYERADWDVNGLVWAWLWWAFGDQLFRGDPPESDFPLWLERSLGWKCQPKIIIEPEANPPRYHWHNPQNPLYVVHPDDDGLRWNLLRWTENP